MSNCLGSSDSSTKEEESYCLPRIAPRRRPGIKKSAQDPDVNRLPVAPGSLAHGPCAPLTNQTTSGLPSVLSGLRTATACPPRPVPSPSSAPRCRAADDYAAPRTPWCSGPRLLDRYVVVNPVQSPLEQRPVGFYSVGVGHVPDILARAVLDRLMGPGHSGIGGSLVGIDHGAADGVTGYEVLERRFVRGLHDLGCSPGQWPGP